MNGNHARCITRLFRYCSPLSFRHSDTPDDQRQLICYISLSRLWWCKYGPLHVNSFKVKEYIFISLHIYVFLKYRNIAHKGSLPQTVEHNHFLSLSKRVWITTYCIFDHTFINQSKRCSWKWASIIDVCTGTPSDVVTALGSIKVFTTTMGFGS